ncbi:DUF7373 family lipoprotein [Gordonia sp. DT101]|uniref:DUF7373 family lipoprotein n=1 Tax=Gordonia sp. DT101 TaxID=3416545 RepID=UPI003CF97E65
MKIWQPAVRWIWVAVAVAVLAACSTDTDSGGDQSAAASSQASDPSIDVSALNTGKYPTEPRAAFGKTTDDNIIQWEGQRMTQFMVVPFEVDPDMTVSQMPVEVVGGPNNMSAVLNEKAAHVPGNDAIISGFVTSATTSENKRNGNPRSLQNMVVRYLTRADATTAAQQMAQATAANNESSTTNAPGLDGTKVVKTDANGNKQIAAFTPHGVYVLYQWYEVTPAQENLLDPTINKAVKLQAKLIDQFPRLLTTDEAKEKGITREPSITDQNHVLIYALPYSDDEMKNGTTSLPSGLVHAVYGPRGLAQFWPNPESTFKVLSEVGSTANAVERSNVYRADDSAGAKRIVDTFTADNKSTGWADVPAPQALPIAKCQTMSQGIEGINDTNYNCFVQKGRYVGEVSAKQKEDAYQQISAQYVILTKADQDAH